ncbi:MAG: single-stranded-DNA-specific exonuclease RecJ [Candidatus Omnitrophota bacterium]|nr:single-stranded-DNA-specific exonuclease RecJ [Candidatus Omnitrophota bacterium]
MQKIWNIPSPLPFGQIKLAKNLDIHPLIAQILINRNITDESQARIFLEADLSMLYDPFRLKDMDRAVERIKQAKRNNESVLIFGDYDVDGITACALLKSTLLKMGLKVSHYIPHRLNEGYGLNGSVEKLAKHKKIDLLISVDCGITSIIEIEALNKTGIDTIIVDHHEPLKHKLPKAVAIINSKRHDCTYPFKDLAAVGLVFKLCGAMEAKTLTEDLDFVALGTIADVMSLTGENRILVKHGLKQINRTKKKGLQALIEVSGLKDKSIEPSFISFILAPRLNASGRLSSAEKSLSLLLSQDLNQALNLARELNDENKMRQKIQEEILSEALSLVEKEVNFKEHNIIVVSKQGWHRGVLGIVASKITERFYRPSIVISLEQNLGRGSGRSIESFHLFNALSSCSSLLKNFGGHAFAAGLTISKENIEPFKLLLNSFAKEKIAPQDLNPSLKIDAEFPLSALNLKLIKDIENLAPFGVGNPKPLLCSRNLKLKGKPIVLRGETIKFWVTDGKLTCQVLGFGMVSLLDIISEAKHLDLVYTPAIDTWREEPAIQIELKDIKVG